MPSALAELYDYYRGTHAMWATAYRDAGLVESLGAIMDAGWFVLFDRAVDVLATGRVLRGHRRQRMLGALRLAVDFPTWRTLTSAGLGDHAAAAIAVTFVAAAEEAEPRRGGA